MPTCRHVVGGIVVVASMALVAGCGGGGGSAGGSGSSSSQRQLAHWDGNNGGDFSLTQQTTVHIVGKVPGQPNCSTVVTLHSDTGSVDLLTLTPSATTKDLVLGAGNWSFGIRESDNPDHTAFLACETTADVTVFATS